MLSVSKLSRQDSFCLSPPSSSGGTPSTSSEDTLEPGQALSFPPARYCPRNMTSLSVPSLPGGPDYPVTPNEYPVFSLECSPPPSAEDLQLVKKDQHVSSSRCKTSPLNGVTPVPTFSPQPLITVTINPLEQDEVTFIPSSPVLETSRTIRLARNERQLSIGSATSLEAVEDGEENERLRMLGLSPCGIRRVSDISHIKQLRREISGLSHLASEFYTVTKADDPDSLSLDSLHVRVLERCSSKYESPNKSKTNRYFVVITLTLTVLGISYGFWFKNFASFSDDRPGH